MRILREWIRRLLGTLHAGSRDADLAEELRTHMELAAAEARRLGLADGDAIRTARLRAGGLAAAMDALRDQRGFPSLSALKSDVVAAVRQLLKHRVSSGAAILSLGLAFGATTAAFRLVDAVLLRPLPVAEPHRLFVLGWNAVTRQGETEYRDFFDYPAFRRYRAAAGERGQVMVVGSAAIAELQFSDSRETERVRRQFFSGNVFSTFGLRPALGRLLTSADDVTPGAHPVAVISFGYWTSRFGNDPNVLGRPFRIGTQPFEIIGVTPEGFTGTEPGRLTDLFLPATMNQQALDRRGVSWFRIWVSPAEGTSPTQLREALQAQFSRDHQDDVRNLPLETPQLQIDAYLREQIVLSPAAAGASDAQRFLRRPLLILAALVGFVLLIACANVANLLTARTVARTREMALRVSIGCSRWRLIQLVLVESTFLAMCASTVGALFAWWAAPFVVSLLAPAEDPVRLVLGADWRLLWFAVALTSAVAVLFGLAAALRVSATHPLTALKGHTDLHPHRRFTRLLIGMQMAFCIFILFVTGLLVATFRNLSSAPLGFSHENVLLLETQVVGGEQLPDVWEVVMNRLREAPGVESVAMAGWVPLSGNRWRASVYTAGRTAEEPTYVLDVSPEFFSTLRIGHMAGRDFRPGDKQPKMDSGQPAGGVGIVNEAFARLYFDGANPVGRQVRIGQSRDGAAPMEIVGLVRDMAYYSIREPMRPIVYVPAESRSQGALIVRSERDPLDVADTLRRMVPAVRSDFRVQNVLPQTAMVRSEMTSERLLAVLSSFFAIVALSLAGVGLYGILNYAVIRQRREIGVRIALGAQVADVMKQVTSEALIPVAIGVAIGLGSALAAGRLLETLLFQIPITDPIAIVAPVLLLCTTAMFASLSPVIRAVRVDPAQTLRSE